MASPRARDAEARDGAAARAVHLVAGPHVGRRSLGRKLAFATLALHPAHDAWHAAWREGAGGRAPGDGDRDLKVTFSHQAFLGPDADDPHSTLNDTFPTKRTRLPYGASVVVQVTVGEERPRGPTEGGGGARKYVCEVLRWKVTEHPRDLAERVAALDVDPPAPTGGAPRVTLGSGALSNTLYLRARREAFEGANRRRAGATEGKGEGADGIAAHSAETLQPLPAGTPLSNAESLVDAAEFQHGGKHAKALRARIFASWVLETFFGIPMMGAAMDIFDEETLLCQPCSSAAEHRTEPAVHNVHVLDIAGGKGELSLELILQQLAFADGATAPSPPRHAPETDAAPPPAAAPWPISRCTIVDPMVRKGDAKRRHARLKRARSRAEWRQRERRQREPPVGPRAVLPRSEPQLEACDREGRAEPSGQGRARDAIDGAAIQHLATYFTAQTFPQLCSRCSNAAGGPPLAPTPESPNLAQLQRQRPQTPVLLLGLHPDECTEDILDAALEHNLSVAIVPCCVFADLFPARRLAPAMRAAAGGDAAAEPARARRPGEDAPAAVRTYEDFLRYLLAKDGCLRTATLPFEGKNRVIYRKVP